MDEDQKTLRAKIFIIINHLIAYYNEIFKTLNGRPNNCRQTIAANQTIVFGPSFNLSTRTKTEKRLDCDLKKNEKISRSGAKLIGSTYVSSTQILPRNGP